MSLPLEESSLIGLFEIFFLPINFPSLLSRICKYPSKSPIATLPRDSTGEDNCLSFKPLCSQSIAPVERPKAFTLSVSSITTIRDLDSTKSFVVDTSSFQACLPDLRSIDRYVLGKLLRLENCLQLPLFHLYQ